MFDCHCHLTDPRIRDEAPALWAEAQRCGVEEVALAGVDEEDWRAQIEFAAGAPGVHTAFGLHPQVVAELEPGEVRRQLDALRVLVGGSHRPAALGETGLDRAVAAPATLPAQEAAFREQLALAREANLPVVLHILRAQEAALRILEADGVPAAGGIVHSYSGSAELVPRYVRLGLFLSFAGPVANPQAARIHQAARAVPDAFLLAETDAPDQTPWPHRPGPNRPSYLPTVIAALADVRGATPESIAALTAANARRVLSG